MSAYVPENPVAFLVASASTPGYGSVVVLTGPEDGVGQAPLDVWPVALDADLAAECAAHGWAPIGRVLAPVFGGTGAAGLVEVAHRA